VSALPRCTVYVQAVTQEPSEEGPIILERECLTLSEARYWARELSRPKGRVTSILMHASGVEEFYRQGFQEEETKP
jgi:hypothetical protein